MKRAHIQIRTRLAFVAAFSALFLGACAISPKDAADVAVYDFGLPAPAFNTNGRWSALRVEVAAPAWAESLRVDYRLVYDEPLKQREYANSHWAAGPDVLLARLLRQQLGALGAAPNIASKCLLSIDLQTFSQVFATAGDSRGVLHASVHLVDTRHQMLAEHRFHIEQVAPSPDARGGVQALMAASTELGRQLSTWLGDLDRKNGLNGCRPAR